MPSTDKTYCIPQTPDHPLCKECTRNMENNPDLKNHPRLSMTTMKPTESSAHSHCSLYLTKGH